MTDDELLELNWGRALVHESGHALMAAQKDIPCRGIYYNKTVNKFCAVVDLPPESAYSKEHYLFLAASSAAELAIYGDQDEAGARSDRLAFQNAGAPPLQDTLSEAHRLMVENETKLKRLVSDLKSRCLQVDLNLGALPVKVGMDGSDHEFAVLLTKEELEDTLRT
jgi:hypothetical protein